MKIFVLPRFEVEDLLRQNPKWHEDKYVISIFEPDIDSPLPDGKNILKLAFHDLTEEETFPGAVHFTPEQARRLAEFVREVCIEDRPLFIHCAAGISRSGAVGFVLNEYFNKFLRESAEDDEFFRKTNPYILPNPLVTRLLKREFFGDEYKVFIDAVDMDGDHPVYYKKKV